MIFNKKGLNKDEHFNIEVEFILDGFLVKNAITLFYAPPKNGKSCLAIAVAKYILQNTNFPVYYLDFDNPLVSLKDKKIDEFIGNFESLVYLHEEILCMTGKEALNTMVKDCEEKPLAYKDIVMIFDSVTDFLTNETDDTAVKAFMHKVKMLRNAGVTVILLHHTNKKDGNYKGSSILKSASDNVFALTSEVLSDTEDNMLLRRDAGRFGNIKNCAFKVTKYIWEIEPIDYDDLCLPYHKREFIREVRKVLAKEKQLNQTKLLEAIGKPEDKTAREYLAEYAGRYWICEDGGRGKAKNYTLK